MDTGFRSTFFRKFAPTVPSVNIPENRLGSLLSRRLGVSEELNHAFDSSRATPAPKKLMAVPTMVWSACSETEATA